MAWLWLFLEGRWLEHWLQLLCNQFPEGHFFHYRFNIVAALALILVGLNCGMVGSLVVGSRMAFFSDALAHCAFAGVSIGFVLFEVFLKGVRPDSEFWNWVTPVMVIFGVMVGYGIAFVRQSTGLASDTVIGVFFAGAIGLAALIRRLITSRRLFSLEDFLFGDPLVATGADLVGLFLLTIFTACLLGAIYNRLLLSSFNPSLALSRRVPSQLVQYLFVMLLALVVNLCLRAVGVLLINALMVVPAATSANVSRNLRQMFWRTVILTVAVGLIGQAVSWEVEARTGLGFTVPGTVILLSVFLFIVSVWFGPRYRSWRGRAEATAPV